MFFIKTFDSKISWNINKIYFKTFSHPFQISFISNFDSNTFISNPKSNIFQIYFSLVIKYQMVPSYFHIKSKIKYISNIFFSGHQISNGAKLLSYQIQNQIHFKYIFLWSSNIKWCPVTFISNPKSNTFQIYFSLVINYQMVPSYVGLSNGWLAANCSF